MILYYLKVKYSKYSGVTITDPSGNKRDYYDGERNKLPEEVLKEYFQYRLEEGEEVVSICPSTTFKGLIVWIKRQKSWQ